METKYYVLRIDLLDAHQPVWREVTVPSDILLSDLCEVIQLAMGWEGDHMSLFEFKGQTYESLEFAEDLSERPQEATELHELLKRARQKLIYTYDFGDNWRHSVTLKKALPWDCVISLTCEAGEGACPLEDCGGVTGYEKICNYARGLPGSDDGFLPYEEWGVKEYDPDLVDLDQINQDLGLFAEEINGEEGDLALQDIFEEIGAQPDFGLFDGMEEDAEEEEDACAEPYAGLGDPERLQFREAMDQAAALRELAPWKDLWDQDIFCIKDPETGLLDFVSILGRGGEVFALHVHHGIEGYHLWQRTMLGTMPMDDPDLYMQSLRVTEVEFVNKSQMEQDDFNLYDQASYLTPSRGRQRWMRFRRYHPRAGAPWFPSADELPRLVRAIRLCTKYIEMLRSQPKAGRSQYKHQNGGQGELATSLPCFTLAERSTVSAMSGEDLSAWEFSHVPMNWDEADELAVAFEPLEFELQQFSNLPQVDEAWELGAVYLRQPVGTPDGPVLPILAVAAPLEAIEATPVPYLGSTLEMTPGEAIWRGLLQSALSRGCRPAEVHVVTPLGEATLKPLEALSATRIVRQPNFHQLHELLSMMSQF